MTQIIINQNQARDFAIECYDTIVKEIKASLKTKKGVTEDASQESTAPD